MKKEIDYRFDNENKLTKTSTKDQEEKIYSYRFSKYPLSILKIIEDICCFAMIITILGSIICLPIDFLLRLQTLEPWEALVDLFLNSEFSFVAIVLFLSEYYEKKTNKEIFTDYSAIFFWLIFFAASKVMP